jgi:NADPH2:quinone reductase
VEKIMKAVLCKQFGPVAGLTFEDVPNLVAGPGQVLLDVKAAGINFPDSLFIEGRYQVRPSLPFTPGLEAAGVISAVGEGVTGLTPGMRVAVNPEIGAFAEQIVVAQERVFPIPDAMDFATAAGFMIAYGTSHNALKDRAQLQPGETLLVLGAAGGIGLTAVELGKVMGARVIAAASSPEKLALCKEYGADALIDYSREDLRARVKELTGGKGVNVVYDPVGGAHAEPAVRSLARYGRYLVMGFAAGDIPKIPLNLLLLKTCSLVGAFWGQFVEQEPARNQQNMAELLAWYADGKLRPHISKTFPLAQAAAGIEYVAARRAMGKVVLLAD